MIIQYFIYNSGRCPVRDFIDSLSIKQRVKLFRLFTAIETYGLMAVQSHIKKLTNSRLWELRILGKDNIRFLYITIDRENIIIFQGFIKKTNKTPRSVLIKVERFYQQWKNVVDK